MNHIRSFLVLYNLKCNLITRSGGQVQQGQGAVPDDGDGDGGRDVHILLCTCA